MRIACQVQGAQRNAWNPAAKPQCSVKSLATARPRRARERIKHRVVIVSDDPRTQQAINGAPRRRRKAARARRRKTSEHGAHHVARAAPAARAGSEDGAAVRVHRRRTDQGGHGAPLLRPRRGARPGRTQLVSLSHDSTPWGPRNGAPWRRRWPDANDYVSGF
ncbi:hypothetical protein PAHAL_3G044900 [Panicum hallii]|uniref:Uncharacterized protein n=1 Tax=Panicum hallii TaxID=206008 RepID=A0A2T8KH24_9POAL|nr:hypothetical protein PAHAL_3G044900 [Panicum hallii]